MYISISGIPYSPMDHKHTLLGENRTFEAYNKLGCKLRRPRQDRDPHEWVPTNGTEKRFQISTNIKITIILLITVLVA